MPRYAYEARDDDGQLTGGLIAAESLEQAGQLLSERNLYVVRLAADSREGGRARAIGARQGHMRASRAQVAWWMSQLSVMVETGIHLSEALDCLARQSSDSAFRNLLEHVSKAVQEGRSLADAMAMHPKSFPPTLTAMVRAAEMSGTLTRVLHRSSMYLMHELQVFKKMRGAVLYPVFMMLTCLAVTVFVLVAILPQFADIFADRGAMLPLPTRILMGASEALLAYWYLWLGGTAALAGALWLWVRTSPGRRQRDHLLLNLPVLRTVFHPLYQSRMFGTLATLLDAGVSIVESIRIVQEVVPNTAYRRMWAEVDDRIRNGERMTGALLESSLLTEPVAQMIDAGDRAGKLGFVFNRLAEFIEQEYNQAVSTATRFIEPVMILFMGGIIGFIAAALMLPLFEAGQVLAQ